MTRQEFERKTEDGTLTVRELLDNLEYATPEQVDFMAKRQMIVDAMEWVQLAKGCVDEVNDMLAHLRQDLDTADEADAWALLSGQDTRGDEAQQALRDAIVRVEDITIRVAETLDRDDIPPTLRETLNRGLTSLSRLNKCLHDTLEDMPTEGV